MKRILLLILALLLCLSAIGCTNASNTENTTTQTPTEAPTENPVEVAKEKLANAVEECYTSKYSYIMAAPFMTIAGDGTSILIDTEPDDTGYYSHDEDAVECIVAINNYLSLPSSLLSKMQGTSALDGTQSQDCGEYTVTWSYHPDNGLEVIYEVNLH